jgi:hypothetical protein
MQHMCQLWRNTEFDCYRAALMLERTCTGMCPPLLLHVWAARLMSLHVWDISTLVGHVCSHTL